MSTDHNPLVDNGEHGDGGLGTATGIRQAIAEAGPLLPLRDAEQLELLREESGNATTSSSHVSLAPRGRGRPQGARNRQTQEVRSYLLSRYAHPLEFLSQVFSRPTDALAAELGCSKKEAAFLQVRAAAEVAPFVEGKMPVAIDLAVRGDMTLIIPGVNISQAEADMAANGDFIPYGEYSDVGETGQ
jgi:phage gp36-like protein